MNDLYIGTLVFICAFGAAALAMWLRRLLPEHHMSAETKDTVKISMGLVVTMTALILGLLVNSAKRTYEDEKQVMTAMTAKIAVLNRILVLYGPEAAGPRKSMHDTVQLMLQRYWPETESQPARLDPETASADAVYRAVLEMSPQNDEQRDLKARALESVYEIGEMRWLLFTQAGPSVSTPLLVVVACWLALLYFSFGLFAPPNGTVFIALFASTIAVASAVFLILELDQPFDGLIKISSQPLVETLNLLAKRPI